jgi:hypothetical protein
MTMRQPKAGPTRMRVVKKHSAKCRRQSETDYDWRCALCRQLVEIKQSEKRTETEWSDDARDSKDVTRSYSGD